MPCLGGKLGGRFASSRHDARTNDPHRANRVNGARHDLVGPRPARAVPEPCLQQLGIREDDSKLIVQAVKQGA